MIHILLFDRFGANKACAGVHQRFTDCLGVSGIGLVTSAEKGLDALRLDEPDSVAHRFQRPRPMMSGAAGFNADRAWMKFGEEFDHAVSIHFSVADFPTSHFSVADFPTSLVSRKNLENVLGNIHTDIVRSFHDPPPCLALLTGDACFLMPEVYRL
jgi:hypothetical protein